MIATPSGPVAAPARTTRLGTLLLVCGLVGAAASFALLLDKFAMLRDPFYIPSCTIDAVLQCGTVMSSPQAEAFGFPNPLIGLAAFPVVATVGVAARTGASRTLWLGLLAGATAGVVFVHWLIAQSLYVIGALCPYCMAVWVVTVLVFWYTALHTVRAGLLPVAAPVRALAERVAPVHTAVPAAWLAIIALLVVLRFVL